MANRGIRTADAPIYAASAGNVTTHVHRGGVA